ncbi:hypothetical protein SLA2020_412330 [Shorea laevis]
MSISCFSLLFCLPFLTFLTIHSKPVTSPYLSPTTIFPNYQNMLKTFKIFMYTPNAAFTFNSQLSHSSTPLFRTARLSPATPKRLTSSSSLSLPVSPRAPSRVSLDVFAKSFRTGTGRSVPTIFTSRVPPYLHFRNLTCRTLRRTEPQGFLGYFGHSGVKESSLVNELVNDPDFLIESEPPNHLSYTERLASSKFCLFEYGGDVSGIGKALRFGCVPAVITDRPIQDLPFLDVLRWQEIVVFVPVGGVKELKLVLGRTYGDRHEQMSKLGVKASQHFVWNEVPQPLDSFHTVMYQLWLRRHTIRYPRRE